MKNKILRKVDSQGRIVIPKILVDIAGLSTGSVALVSVGEEMVSIIPNGKNVRGMHVIGVVNFDSKNRMYIPQYLRDGINEVEVFLLDGNVTIR